jgi:hypothetical protein
LWKKCHSNKIRVYALQACEPSVTSNTSGPIEAIKSLADELKVFSALALWADSNNSAMSSDLETDSNQDSNYSFSENDIYPQTTNDSYRTADYNTDES